MVDSEPLYNGNHSSSNGNASGSGARPATGKGANPGSAMEQDQGNYMQQKIMAGLLRFKWLILLAALAGGVAAWYYTENITPEYLASGMIIIHQDSEESLSSGGDITSRLNRSLGPAGTRSMDNHVQLLKSRVFAERIAEKLMEQEVMSNGEVFPVLLREIEGNEPLKAAKGQVVSRLRSKADVKRVSGSDDLIEISYISHDPLEAKELANLFMNEFVELTDERARSSIQATLQYLQDEMLNKVGGRLADSEQRIEDFMRSEPGGLNLASHTDRLVGQVHTLEEEAERNRLELESIENRKERAQDELNEIEPGLTDQMKSATTARVRMLQENMANLTIERMLMLNKNPSLRTNEDQEPRLKEINNEMDQISNEIDELVSEGLDQTRGFLFTEAGEMNSRILELQRQIADLTVERIRLQSLINLAEKRISDYNEELDQLPEKQTRMARLQRERERDERMYNELAGRAFEMGLMEQSTRGSGRIFEDALQPGSPFRPDVPTNLLLGILLGMGLAVSGVFLRVMLDYRIDSIDLLKKYGLPVLSVIPDMKPVIRSQFKGQSHYKVVDKKLSTLLVPLYDPISNVSESFRRLFNNLRFNNPDSRNKLFVLTSPGKGEGKTTTISNLAITMGESGNRVLLLDCDFRKPHVHRMFGLDMEPGITDYLFDDTPLEELIVSAQAPGLDILTSGKQTVSPDRAINSNKMRRLIEEVTDKYDYILIDTAPFGIISDAAPLIRMSDGVIALVRFNKSKTPELDHLIENLNSISAEVVGTVLNDFNPKVASGYYTDNRKYAYNDKVYKSYSNKVKKPDKKEKENV
ncbi:polysaccharide biosynthesis tyrosine autokinase [Natronogracilivirga saccharolytica]|uniref:Polysaccharide biosynthesis tyrosine autokinase n=1 Tax=Natronogracilivirga saccharolytica TaxID=2812953 RepID=A0A8J7RMS5_9BACT|nr:polysaccharide biosynthesis tyrosine autokinase [Natronogracilivirga saccharolytica]MBP3193845.1 polysaccharide biosynthesis tyrosine autokinase [Natronogracilivirga saccharolytica]